MFEIKNIDGQELLVFDTSVKEEILLNESEYFNREPLTNFIKSGIELIKISLELILPYDNLLFAVGQAHGRYFPYTLYFSNGVFFRVFVEEIKCLNCKRVFLIANPFVSDNWLGVDDIIKKKKLEKIEKVMRRCNFCNTELKRSGFLVDSFPTNALDIVRE